MIHNTKKIMTGISIVLICVALFLAKLYFVRSNDENKIKIGILTIASHPALDAVKDGFKEELQSIFGDSVNIIFKNADGLIPNAQLIAQSFHDEPSFDLFFGISTPALQSLALLEKNRPIIFAAATDITQFPEVDNKNICGVTDVISSGMIISDTLKVFPSIKTMGVLFNPTEINSVKGAQEMIHQLQTKNVKTLEIGIMQESEIPTALESKSRIVDAFISPTDNMVASAISIISKIALAEKKPVVVMDTLLVKHGATLARGVDYRESGIQAAKMAEKIINQNQMPQEIGVETGLIGRLFANQKSLQALEVAIPVDVDVIIVD